MIVLSRLLSKSRQIFLGTDYTDYTDFFEIITLFELSLVLSMSL